MSRTVAMLARAILQFLICVGLLVTLASADEPAIPRIGVLAITGSTVDEDLRQELRDLGYVDGKNIIIVSRRVSGHEDEELRRAVADLVGSNVGLIVLFTTPAARIALQTTKLPVVFAAGDPIGDGLAASLARPGGRGTGVSMLNSELAGKRMQLLRQVAPGLRRVAFLMNPANPLDARMLLETQSAARALGVEVVVVSARNASELDEAFTALPRGAHDGLLISNDHIFIANRARIAQAVRKAKIPAVFPFNGSRDDGALMSYGQNLRVGYRSVAVYVDKILKGAQPSELPIEQITDIELVIDLRVARAMGIRIPQDLLLRANEAIR